MDQDEVLEWYQGRTDLQGRYRVIEDLEGTRRRVPGRMIYRVRITTLPATRNRNYQYSPYLLEALMQS